MRQRSDFRRGALKRCAQGRFHLGERLRQLRAVDPLRHDSEPLLRQDSLVVEHSLEFPGFSGQALASPRSVMEETHVQANAFAQRLDLPVHQGVFEYPILSSCPPESV